MGRRRTTKEDSRRKMYETLLEMKIDLSEGKFKGVRYYSEKNGVGTFKTCLVLGLEHDEADKDLWDRVDFIKKYNNLCTYFSKREDKDVLLEDVSANEGEEMDLKTAVEVVIKHGYKVMKPRIVYDEIDFSK